MIHLNSLERTRNGNKETATFWHQIDTDLLRRRTKPAIYKLAFASLIIKKDRQLFDGERPAGQVGELDAALPTEQQINAEVEHLLNNPEQQEAGEDQ
jgi:hypothetical protein